MHVTLEVNMLSEVPRIIYARADLLTTWMNYYGCVAELLHDLLHRSIPVVFRIPYMHSNKKLKIKIFRASTTQKIMLARVCFNARDV